MGSDLKFDAAFRAEVKAHLAGWARRDDSRALKEVLIAVAAYLLSFGAMAALAPAAWSSVGRGAVATAVAQTALLVTVAFIFVGTAVRVFSLHHDLCHGALFSTQRQNRVVATLLGTLVSASPSVWTREHDRHHRDSNNLDRAQDGETASWTVEHYRRAAAPQRWAYILLNQRLVLFAVLPPLYFLVFMRVRARWFENAVFFVFAFALWKLGLVWLFVAMIVPGSMFGFFTFHAHHTFDGVYRRRAADWDFFDNCMLGACILVWPQGRLLGPALSWFTLNLGVHALHHLNPGIPGYDLGRALEARPELFVAVKRVTVVEALKTMRYTLFDEATGAFTTASRVKLTSA